MFLGEKNRASQRSGLTGAYHNDYGNSVSGSPPADLSGGSLPPTPPDDCPIGDSAWMMNQHDVGQGKAGWVGSWLEIWDYAGGSSFRAFLAEDAAGEDKTMFVFFDAHVLGRDLKQAYVFHLGQSFGELH